MAIKITDCHFENNGTGIKAPTSAEIELSGSTFKDNGRAMDIFISVADLRTLGLPENTPQEYIKEVLQILSDKKGITEEEQLKSISDSKLFKWLGYGGSIASIASAIIAFSQTL